MTLCVLYFLYLLIIVFDLVHSPSLKGHINDNEQDILHGRWKLTHVKITVHLLFKYMTVIYHNLENTCLFCIKFDRCPININQAHWTLTCFIISQITLCDVSKTFTLSIFIRRILPNYTIIIHCIMVTPLTHTCYLKFDIYLKSSLLWSALFPKTMLIFYNTYK